MLTSVKITKKGQVTIPKRIRERLNTEVVQFAVVGDEIVIRPVKSVGGSLRRYAETKIPFVEAREKAWEEVAHERYAKKTNRR